MTQSEELDDKLEAFLAALPTVEDDLLAYVQGIGRAEVLPFDFTFESLGRVETLLSLILDKVVSLPNGVRLDQMRTALAGYVGHTILRQLGGVWTITDAKSEPFAGNPAVGQMPGLPKNARIYPLQVLGAFEKWRQAGSIEWTVRTFDMKALERMLEDVRSNASRFVVSLEQRLGVTLDFEAWSLDVVEKVYSACIDASRPYRLAMRAEVEVYAGEVIRRKRGWTWDACKDPRRGEFGQLCVGQFAPGVVIRNFEIGRESGLLRSAAEAYLRTAT